MLRMVGRAGLLVGMMLLWGCTVVGLKEVPIVDRSVWADRASIQGTEPAVANDASAAESVGAAGGYVVKPSDTLYSIALTVNQDVNDLARWNGITDPSQLRTGQVLRVMPPVGEVASGVTVVDAPPVLSQSIESRPLDGSPMAPAVGVGGGDSVAPPAAGIIAPGAQPDVAASAAKPLDQTQTTWIWPAQGQVLQSFAEGSSKGIDIAGEEGDPVLAAQDGQVVYSGNSLKGFGNLIIIKHEDDIVSAYAHNKINKVEHGQAVKKGQQIAELGRTDTSKPKLHFEIRRKGKAVDPVNFLPSRP